MAQMKFHSAENSRSINLGKTLEIFERFKREDDLVPQSGYILARSWLHGNRRSANGTASQWRPTPRNKRYRFVEDAEAEFHEAGG
jgi:hypothetical protein